MIPGARGAVSAALLLAALLLAAPGSAEGATERSDGDVCTRPCRGSVRCERAVLDCLLEADRSRDAVTRLKQARTHHPQRWQLGLLLAKAYLADNNPFWAQRTLLQLLQQQPDNCAVRAWLAWTHYTEGDLDLAHEQLEHPGCPDSETERGRWLLLTTMLARAEGDEARVAELVQKVAAVDAVFPEDSALWRSLRRTTDPGWIEPLSGRLDLRTGLTSNARAGSPTDPGISGPPSTILRLDHFGRLVVPASRTFRPSLEVGLKGHGITAAEVARLSYLDMSARPGVVIGSAFPRLLVSYKADLLVLGDRDKRLFYEGHRVEGELETEGGLLVFLGGGQRVFRENGRTRAEIDGGAGGSIDVFQRARLLLAGAARYYDAIGDPYDLIGATGLAVARIPIVEGFSGRVGLTLGTDLYPNSGGELGYLAYGTDEIRFDVLTKFTAGVWSPPLEQVQLGLAYDLAWRVSSANQSQSYDYTEHRVTLAARWSFDMDPWAPRVVDPGDHIPLSYGVAEGPGAAVDDERIQDLLRQDEAARRGSSCVE